MEHWPHFFSNGRWYVNLEGVFGDLIFDLERAHCFRCQGSKWARLISVVLTLVDQNVLSHLELIFGSLAVAKCLRPCLLIVQRTVEQVPIRSHFINPVSDLDNLYHIAV